MASCAVRTPMNALPLARALLRRGPACQSLRRLSSHFDRRAKTYDSADKLERIAWMASVVRGRPWFQSPDGAMGEALDFGCGTGLLTFEMLPHCSHVTGVDVSTGMLEIMAEKARSAGLESKVARTTTSLAQLPQQYDFVFSALAVHHVKDCGQLVKQLMEVTRPGGRLLLIDFEASPQSRLFHRAGEQKGVHFEHDGIAEDSLLEWMRDAGGEDLDLVKEPFHKALAADWNRPGESEQFQMLFAAAAAPAR